MYLICIWQGCIHPLGIGTMVGQDISKFRSYTEETLAHSLVY